MSELPPHTLRPSTRALLAWVLHRRGAPDDARLVLRHLEQQIDRVYRGFKREPNPLAKYQYLRALQERIEILFYALLEKHLDEMLPIVYTPTVGAAVQQFSALYQNPRGLSFSPLNIVLALLGVAAGTIIGSIPGLTATMAVAVLVPITFSTASAATRSVAAIWSSGSALMKAKFNTT